MTKFTRLTTAVALSTLILTTSAQKTEINYEDVFEHECKADGMKAWIKKSDLAGLGSWKENFDLITLNSESCFGQTREDSEYVYFDAGNWSGEKTECDTQLVSNGGIKTFWNMVQHTPQTDSMITRDAEGLYNFSCTYNMTATEKFELSLAHKIVSKPIDQITFAGRQGKGEFSASMELFRNDNFNESFVGGSQVAISIEQFLYIQVHLDAADEDIALTLVDCWATPGPSAVHQIRHTLLEDGCSRDPTVEIIESGTGQTAKWKSQMFEFVKHDSVWLHCDIQACHLKDEECSKPCSDDFSGPVFSLSNKRKKRDTIRVSLPPSASSNQHVGRAKRNANTDAVERNNVYDPNILSVGPINSEEALAAKSKAQMGPVIGIAVVGVIIALAMIYGIWRVLMLKHAEESKIIEANNNNQVGADWNLYSSNQVEDATKQNPMMVY